MNSEPDDDHSERTEVRSVLHRFATPHTFSPNLTVGEAVVAAAATLTRIFLGSLLFAVWGVYSLLLWNAIHSHLLRAFVVPLLVTIFLVLLGVLMLAISAAMRWISHKLH